MTMARQLTHIIGPQETNTVG